MINILIVDDSQVVIETLKQVFSTDPHIQIAGIANNGKQAVEFVNQFKPDVITMDINMPVMDGLEAISEIMQTNPVPIIIISGFLDSKDPADNFKALESGAVVMIEKPRAVGSPEFQRYSKDLIEKVKVLSKIKVFKRTRKNKPAAEIQNNNGIKRITGIEKEIKNRKIEIIAIGTSTGGPVIINNLLKSLPKSFNIPIIIIQHIVPDFTTDFAKWLNENSSIPVEIPMNGDKIEKGKCYIARQGFNLAVKNGKFLLLSDNESKNSPSVSVLFSSVVKEYGSRAIGILLTGMGKDGAKELKEMKDSGALTIVQDKETSVVYGMPGEALKLNAANYVMNPEQISEVLKYFN